MAHVGHKFALCPACGLGCFLRAKEPYFSPFPFGDVLVSYYNSGSPEPSNRVTCIMNQRFSSGA